MKKEKAKLIILKIIVCNLLLFSVSPIASKADVDREINIRFLHHSTGGNLYLQGNVADWFSNYNSTNGTNYNISEINYPTNGYSWNNYPYDWWNLWVTENPDGTPRTPACQSGNANMECLDNLTTQYDVIIFKQCFPGADIGPDTGNPDVASSVKTLENYKEQYRAIRKELDKYPNNLFIVWTLVPLHRLATNAEKAARAKEFVDWVNNDWLTEDGNNHPNIKIFDFWSYVAESNPNPTNGQVNTLKYEYERSHTGSDSHPNTLANQTVGPIFSQAIVDDINDFFANTSTTPSISNISGDISDGGMITVSGNGFGVKSPVVPVLWDDFESGSVNSGWSVVNSLWEVYSGPGQPAGSQYVLRCDRSLAGSIGLRKDIDSYYGDKLYVFVKRRWDFTMESRNQKFLRYWQTDNSQSYVWNYLWATGGRPQYISRDSYTKHTSDGSSTYVRSTYDATPHGEGLWRTEEFFMKLETAIDACDGEMGYRVDNNLHRSFHQNRCMFDADHNSIFRKLYIDNYGECRISEDCGDDQYCCPPGDSHCCLPSGSYVWVDDVYIDNTWARVVLANDANYDSATQIEIQIPTSWSPTSITFTFNQGSFNTGDTAYLFVVDENGAVNETGFPITIGNSNSNQYRADVDNNSQINTTDAMLTLRNSLGLSMTNTNWQTSTTTGDVNCDNITNSTDAMLILRYSLGLSMEGTGWCI